MRQARPSWPTHGVGTRSEARHPLRVLALAGDCGRLGRAHSSVLAHKAHCGDVVMATSSSRRPGYPRARWPWPAPRPAVPQSACATRPASGTCGHLKAFSRGEVSTQSHTITARWLGQEGHTPEGNLRDAVVGLTLSRGRGPGPDLQTPMPSSRRYQQTMEPLFPWNASVELTVRLLLVSSAH